MEQAIDSVQAGDARRHTHGGVEPLYRPAAGSKPDFAKQRVLCEVLRTEQANVATKWYFSKSDQSLLGFETTVVKDRDPCEVYLSDYRATDGGRKMPHAVEVRNGDKRYAVFKVRSWQLAAK